MTRTHLIISGQAADNPGTFTTTRYDISNRAKTDAEVAWMPIRWTPDFTLRYAGSQSCHSGNCEPARMGQWQQHGLFH